MLKTLFFILTLLFPLYGLGDTSTDDPTITSLMTPEGPVKLATIHCPTAHTLVYNSEKMTWSAPGDFNGFNTSFTKEIKAFTGAQWTGAGLGQIFCVYSGPDKLALPIVLAHNVISLEPTPQEGIAWGEKQGGHYNCISSDHTQCPFQVRLKKPEQTIGDEFDSIKPGSIKTSN